MPVHYAFRRQSAPPAGRPAFSGRHRPGRAAADVRCTSHRSAARHRRAALRTACARRANVAEFPAGIGHNYGFASVTPAQRGAQGMRGREPHGY